MEAILLVVDVTALIITFLWAIQNDGKRDTTGLFRFKDDRPEVTLPARAQRSHGQRGR